ncbi:type VII secretion system-associated protein [Nocardia grenadensis]|uniref:type VII secretion system-associated protein n=1 Tax=Nocardia grenadensis TaxID=931537 RepID=UPI0007A5292B|nr:type VII secretion system-associated protein [Nocardia grenadensis]
MVEPPSEAVRNDNWFVLIDPGWGGQDSAGAPPVEAVVGGWELRADGSAGPFRPNPRYCPSGPEVPTDPLDAVLRRVAVGGRLGADLIRMLRDSVVEIGCDRSGRPLLGAAPDGIPCVVVVTAELQKNDVDVDLWFPVHGQALADVVPSGAEVLMNPTGAAPIRLSVENLGIAPEEAGGDDG